MMTVLGFHCLLDFLCNIFLIHVCKEKCVLLEKGRVDIKEISPPSYGV